MSENWFDSATGLFRLDEIVVGRESFRKIMADKTVTDEEVQQQARQVVEQIRKVHDALPEDSRDDVLELLAEMAVLYAIQKYREIQEIKEIQGTWK